MHRWVLSVNGERLFLKGVNVGPTRMALGEATPEELRRDVVLAAEAGLDLIRVHGHITRPELYEAADELGMLIWQDLPLQWGYARSVGKQAARQAAEAVDLLGHHPSVAIWCGHNEPLTLDVRPGEPVASKRTAIEFVSARSCRRWNRSILDARIKRTLERADGTRPVIAHSGIAPHLPQLDGTDSHLYFGWYHGEERDLPASPRPGPAWCGSSASSARRPCRRTPRSWSPSAGRTSTGSGCRSTTRCRRWSFDQRVPPADHATFAGWRQATQRYQARLLRHHIEALRRLKYRPTGGFAPVQPGRRHPGGHVVAARSRPCGQAGVPRRRARRAARSSSSPTGCRPGVAPGETLALDVHVVSDRARADRGRHHLGRPVVAGRRPGLAVAGRHPGRRLRRGSGPSRSSCRRRPAGSCSTSTSWRGDDAVTNRYESLITGT